MQSKNYRSIYLDCIFAALGAAISDAIPKPILADQLYGETLSSIVFVIIIFVVNMELFSILKKPSKKIYEKSHDYYC